MPIGMPELLIIAIVVVLLFGTSKLPKLGQSMGEAIKNFKKGMSDLERDNLAEAEKKKIADKTDTPS